MLLEPTKNKLKQWRVFEKSVNNISAIFSQIFWNYNKMNENNRQICEDQIVTFKQSHILLYQGLLFLTRSTCVIVDARSHTYKSHDFIPRYDIKHGMRCSKSQWWPSKPVSLILACLNRHMSKHTISAPVMPKMAWNRSAFHDVLVQGASNRDITVWIFQLALWSHGSISKFVTFMHVMHAIHKTRVAKSLVPFVLSTEDETGYHRGRKGLTWILE